MKKEKMKNRTPTLNKSYSFCWEDNRFRWKWKPQEKIELIILIH